MATYDTAKRAVNKTLSGTTADTVVFTLPWPIIEVVNRSSTTIWVTWSRDSVNSPAPTPVAGADDVEPVMAGERISIVLDRSPNTIPHVKVVGNGNNYSVVGTN